MSEIQESKERLEDLLANIDDLEAEERRLLSHNENLQCEIGLLNDTIGSLRSAANDIRKIEDYLRDCYVYPEIGSDIWMILEGYRDV